MVDALDWTYRDPLSLELMGETAENKAALVKCHVDLVSNGVGAAHMHRSRR
jgi:hypothetical protein